MKYINGKLIDPESYNFTNKKSEESEDEYDEYTSVFAN